MACELTDPMQPEDSRMVILLPLDEDFFIKEP